MIHDNVAKIYNMNLVAFERAMQQVMTDLTSLIADYALDYKIRYKKSIDKRVKTLESAKEKLKRKQVDELFEIRDLVGLKVIVYNLKDANKLSDLISAKWKDKDIDVEDYIATPKDTGYRAIHINLNQIVEVKDETISVPVEIQIKTLAQDLWSVLSHEDLYKINCEIPEIVRQFSNSLGALLDVADNQAQFIRDFISKKVVISKDLTFDSNDEVDREIIAKIIFDKYSYNITEEEYTNLIKYLEINNITTADIFRKLVECSEIRNIVTKIYKKCGLNDPEPVDIISYGSYVFYQIMSSSEVDVDVLMDVIKESLNLTEHECESCGKLLNEEEISYCSDSVENCDFICQECLDDYYDCMRCGNKTSNDYEVCANCEDHLMSDD